MVELEKGLKVVYLIFRPTEPVPKLSTQLLFNYDCTFQIKAPHFIKQIQITAHRASVSTTLRYPFKGLYLYEVGQSFLVDGDH